MKKGMMFSTDAILALIVVIVFAAWLPQQFGSDEGVSESLRDQAFDRAITGFYDGDAGNESISDGAVEGKCAVAYELNPNDLAQRDALKEKRFCREIK